MSTLTDVANLPKRRYRTVNDLSDSLIKVVGLPIRYQKKLDRAERLVHLCNPIVRAYYALSLSHHRVMHNGSYKRCENSVCIESRKLIGAWGIDRKAMQSSKGRRSREK